MRSRWLDIGQVLFFFFFFALLWTEMKSRSIKKKKKHKNPSHLDRTSLVNKGFIIWPKDVTLMFCYKTLVRPILEYASSALDRYYENDVQTLEKVQRKAARFWTSAYSRYASVREMLRELKLETLQSRRKIARPNILFKLSH